MKKYFIIYFLILNIIFYLYKIPILASEDKIKSDNLNLYDILVNSNFLDLDKQNIDEFQPFSYKSIFFNKDELSALLEAISMYKNGEALILENDNLIYNNKNNQNQGSKIYISSILFIDKDLWTIWLNNFQINSSNNNIDNEFYITDINPNYAEINWKLNLTKWRIITQKQLSEDEDMPILNDNNQIELIFKLYPNQTFNLIDSQIYEGNLISN